MDGRARHQSRTGGNQHHRRLSAHTREFTVETFSPGLRLDHFLAENAPEFSRSRLQALVRDGSITLNGTTVKPGAKLRLGDLIRLTEPPPVPTDNAPEDIALDVLFEDDDLIVIAKPAGLVVHPAVGHASGTLVNALLHHCDELSGIGGVERPGIVHRLDKETSGCIVAAKNDLAHQSLVAQFAGREVKKIYLALAAGRPARRSGDIRAAIGRHPMHRQKMTVLRPGADHRGKDAWTGWRMLGEVPGGSIIECTLHTGRTHQIRVHLKHLGHPVLGDDVYGKRGDFSRQMLHAWKLGFTHPRTGGRLDFTAPIPADFRAAGVADEVLGA